jgi:hypothetical protein
MASRKKKSHDVTGTATEDTSNEAKGAPPAVALGNPGLTADAAKRFGALVKQWKKETEHLSSAARMAKHPAYREIVQLGSAAVPLLLAELQREPDFWFAALREITNEDPVPPQSLGKIEEMAQAWLAWGRAKGYLP